MVLKKVKDTRSVSIYMTLTKKYISMAEYNFDVPSRFFSATSVITKCEIFYIEIAIRNKSLVFLLLQFFSSIPFTYQTKQKWRKHPPLAQLREKKF